MFQQVADPVGGSLALSALIAALPLVTLFVLLGALKWKAWQAGIASLVVALGVAIFAFGMPAGQALLAATEGAQQVIDAAVQIWGGRGVQSGETVERLYREIRALRKAARSDPFIEAVVQSLPQDVIEHGAPSVGQLQERFKVVKSAGHRTALVPEHGGIVSQVFGTALSLLMIPPGGPIEGADTDAVLSRAEFALRAGDIEKAVVEMKGLSGLPAQVSQDWIAAAESRLAVEQTAKVIKAHVALLAASCS